MQVYVPALAPRSMKNVRSHAGTKPHEVFNPIALVRPPRELTADRLIEAHDEIGTEIVGDEEALAVDRRDEALAETAPQLSEDFHAKRWVFQLFRNTMFGGNSCARA